MLIDHLLFPVGNQHHYEAVKSGDHSPELKAIQAYDVWKEKKNYGKVSMGVVRTTYLIDEQGIIVKSNDKVKAAEDPEKMLQELS